MLRIAVLSVSMPLLAGCSRKQGAPAPGAAAPAAGSGAPAAAIPEADLASFASGALVVQEPDPQGAVKDQVIVIELPERSLVKRVEFDNLMVSSAERSAKDITVEASDTGAGAGFTKIADVSLQARVDNQAFPAGAEAPGRWLRLTVRSNHGAPDYPTSAAPMPLRTARCTYARKAPPWPAATRTAGARCRARSRAAR